MLDRNRVPYRAIARGGLIACALLLTCGATSNPPSPSGGNGQATQSQKAASEHQDSKSADAPPQKPSPVIRQQPQDQHGVSTNAQDQSGWYDMPDWWVAIFTGALFMATTGLWLFTALMWNVTRRVANDSEDAITAAQRSAKAAEDAVAKSDELLAHTRDTSEGELRAYVGIDLLPDTTKIEISHQEQTVRVQVLIRNFGKTPAFKIQVSSKIEIRETPIIGVLSEDYSPTSQSTVTLNPNQTIVVGEEAKETPIPADLAREIIDGTKAIYFTGRIDFRDVFKKPRWVDFAMYSHDGNGGNANFWLCDTGNRTSEDGS